MRSSQVAGLCVAVAVIAGGIAREAACRHGLPYVLYWDEYGVLGAALHLWKDRTIDPGFYGYGALLTYATLLVELPDPRLAQRTSAVGSASVGFPGGARDRRHGRARARDEPSRALLRRPAARGGDRHRDHRDDRAARAPHRRSVGRGASLHSCSPGSSAHLLQSGLSVPNVPLAFLATLVAWKTLDWIETGRGLGAAPRCSWERRSPARSRASSSWCSRSPRCGPRANARRDATGSRSWRSHRSSSCSRTR